MERELELKWRSTLKLHLRFFYRKVGGKIVYYILKWILVKIVFSNFFSLPVFKWIFNFELFEDKNNLKKSKREIFFFYCCTDDNWSRKMLDGFFIFFNSLLFFCFRGKYVLWIYLERMAINMVHVRGKRKKMVKKSETREWEV